MVGIELDKLRQNVGHFSNYWELYAFVRQITSSPIEFNHLMGILREDFLNLLLLQNTKRTN